MTAAPTTTEQPTITGHPNPARFSAPIAGLACVAAGIYLLTSHAVGANSYIELLAHGFGIYFLGKGIFVAKSLWLAGEQLLELRGIRDGVWDD